MVQLKRHVKPLVPAIVFALLPTLIGCTPNYNSNYTPPSKLLYRLSEHSFWVNGVAWSPDGKMLASASSDLSVRIWDIASKQTVKQLAFQGDADIVAWSPDNKYLATVSAEPGDDLKIWDTTTWNMVAHIEPGKDAITKDVLTGAAWSADSKYLATAVGGYSDADIGRIKVYDTSNWQVTKVGDAPSGAGEVAWSPDGVNIAFGSSTAPLGGGKATLTIWNTNTNKVTILTDADQADYRFIAWSPDGQYIAIASGAGMDVAVWDANALRKIQTLKGHTAFITSLAWSPTGNKLASGAYDRSALIWDAVSGQSLENFKHGDIVYGVAWSPDGQTLATACADSQVYVWDVK